MRESEAQIGNPGLKDLVSEVRLVPSMAFTPNIVSYELSYCKEKMSPSCAKASGGKQWTEGRGSDIRA
jgi:hypothetical protein